MERIRTEQYQGKRILIVDYGGLAADAYKPVMRDAIRAISAEPAGSTLLLTNVEGTRFTVGTADDLKAYSAAIRPYVKASAVVGLSALQRVIFVTVKPFLTQNLASFSTSIEARAWLASQG